MIAYVNGRAKSEILKSLEAHGFEVCPLSPHPALEEPTSAHADMLLLAVDGTLLVPRGYEIEPYGFDKILQIPEPLGAKYPHDVLLNIAVVGDVVIANTKTASKFALDYLASLGKRIRHVNQGYAHCSTCIVGDNAIITADEGIAKVAAEEGIDVLLISKGNIELPPYGTGFVGGASGATKDTVCFCGSLSYYPDGEKIRSFCRTHGKNTVELYNSPLADVGGILFV